MKVTNIKICRSGWSRSGVERKRFPKRSPPRRAQRAVAVKPRLFLSFTNYIWVINYGTKVLFINDIGKFLAKKKVKFLNFNKKFKKKKFFFFFYYFINQQSEITFFKLMVCLVRCLDEESSSDGSSVPYIRSIGQFLFSRLLTTLARSAIMSGFVCVSILVWCLVLFRLMTSWTVDIPRSVWSVALETYHGAFAIILKILDWLLWIIVIFDLLEHPHSSRPYVQIGIIMVL